MLDDNKIFLFLGFHTKYLDQRTKCEETREYAIEGPTLA